MRCVTKLASTRSKTESSLTETVESKVGVMRSLGRGSYFPVIPEAVASFLLELMATVGL
jgi:hypothetical protein